MQSPSRPCQARITASGPTILPISSTSSRVCGRSLKAIPDKIRNAAFDPSANRGRSRNSPARAALVLVGDITDCQKRFRSWFRAFSRAAKRVQNRAGRHVAYDVRLQEVLALAIAKRLKWKQVQYAVRCDDESCQLSAASGIGFNEQLVELFRKSPLPVPLRGFRR